MKKYLFLVVLAMFLSSLSYAQLTGSKTIPGNYASVAVAIADLNAQGVGLGGVTFNIAAGYNEIFTSVTAGRITTLTGSSGNPIVFQKSGTGANPKITAATGTGTLDAIISIAGCDYLTFDGIDLNENAANSTSASQMEWGYAILKASTSNGSQNITIKNCAVTLNKANTASTGIYSNNHLVSATTQLTLVSASGSNSNLKIYGNTLSNCYTGISVSGFSSPTPYDLFDQNNEIGKDGANIITDFGGSTVLQKGINTLNQNNLIVANNSITGVVSGNGACYGIQLGSSANGSVELYGNTVTLQYMGTGAFYGIHDNMGTTASNSNTINIHDNSVTGCSLPNAISGTCYFINISHGGPNYSFHGNSVTNNTYGSATAVATGSVYYVYLFGNPTTDGTVDVYNNTISNNSRIQSVPGSGTTYMIYVGSRGNVQNTYNNIISNNTTASTGAAYGYYLINAAATKNFYNNILDGINNANGTVWGVYNGNSNNIYIYNNTIRRITSNSAGSTIYGFNFNSLTSGGNDMVVYNNFISELYAPNATNSAPAVVGMNMNAQSVNNLRVYNNTIYMDAVSSGVDFSSTGIFVYENALYNDIRNNIVINKSVANGTGISSALRHSTIGLPNYSLNSNNNNYYAGTPSSSQVIFTDGINSYQTLTDFKLATFPAEMQSVTENTAFVNTSASPFNLHVNAMVPSQVESAGSVILTPIALTTDIDGDARYPNVGYPLNASYAPTAPDMGADEFAGIPNDITGPTIIYTPLGFTSSNAARTLTATITDPHGVPTSGTGLPRLAWKKLTGGTWNYVTGTSIGPDQYEFTFGSGVVQGDTVYYFVVAQDGFTTPAVGAYPFIGVSGFSANPPACSVKPTNPSFYTISAALCGTYTVGVGQNYTTLTDAINDYNQKEITCPVIFQLTDATYASENYPITINHNPGASVTNTLTIMPAAGVSPVISGTSTDCAIKFNGAQYVVLNGSNSAAGNRNLTIQNNNASGLLSVLKFSHDGTSGASNNTVKGCVLQSSLAGILATYGIIMENGTGNGGYTNLLITNNTINTCRFGIYIGGTSINPATNIKLTNNTIGSNNDATCIVRRGVEIQHVDNVLVEGNEVMGQPSGTDANQVICGIYMLSGSNVRILGNKIHDWKPLLYAVGASGMGISYNTDAPTTGEISNNEIYNITFPGSSSNPTSGTNAMGISIGGNVGVLKVYNNTVFMSGNFLAATGTSSSMCMFIGGNNNQLDIRNNNLKNSSQPVSGSPAARTYAIVAISTSTYTALDNNNYFVDGIGANVGYIGLNLPTLSDWQTATGLEANSQSIDPVFTSPTNLLPTATLLNNKGVYITSVPKDITGAMRNNPSDIGAYEFGADPYVQTHTSNSITQNSAVITGAANAAGLTASTYFDYGTTTSYGTSVAATPGSVTGSTTTAIQYAVSGLNTYTTYHYRARSVASNGMISYGVDSTFTTLPVPPVVVTTAATAITAAGATLNGSVNPNGINATVTIEYGLTTTYGTTVAATPGSVTGITPTNVSALISGLTAYTTYHFRVVATSASGTVSGNDMTFTTLAVPSTVNTLAATNIAATSATLNGSVNANYAPTDVTFEWGLTTAYGNTVNAAPLQVTGNILTAVSAPISGLTTATVYHFRCVGNGPGGTVYGNDVMFTSDCPTPALPGIIAGPNTVCKNTMGVAYSVAPISGATGYVWTVPSGATIASGSNTNSITVDFSPSAVNGIITVTGTNSCGPGAIGTMAIVMNELPIPTVSGPVSMCSNTAGNVYITDAGMTNYTWNVTGGIITAGAGTNSIEVTWNTAGTQTVDVNYSNSNGCSAATPVAYPVAVLELPVPTISGANVACESAAYLDYITEPGMTNYVWDLTPNSGTISQSTTNIVTIFWTASGAKWVSVSYTGTNGCAAATPTIYNVTVNPLPAAPGVITGTATVCAGATGIAYSVAAVSGATGYSWTLPAGTSIASGTGTNSITVNFGSSAVSGNILVAAQNACGDGPSSPAFAVIVNQIPLAAGTITGPSTVCQGSAGITYSVATISGATSYNWAIPAGASIVSGANTNSISVDFSLAASTGSVAVSGTNTCGTGTPSTMAVTVNTKPATPVITQNINILSSDAPTGNQWYRDGILIPGAVEQTYTILQDGTYTDIVTLNGCSSEVSNSIVVIHTGLANPDVQVVNVYPNPSNGSFWLTINTPGTTVYEMEILNSFGAVVYQSDKLQVNGTFKQYFDLQDLSSGMYTLMLRSDSQKIVKKIVINK
jgi:hypothetical protein